ncbi:MAG: hypothetical protein IJP25_03700 [Elusimicrobiaceae bacterium]|nr:hypothetical protein [Elusimicrobiaceae bacterium]
MQLAFNTDLAAPYHSFSQQIRVMSEDWLSKNLYCVKCGNSKILPCKNNTPVQDFYCNKCQEIFELKSTHTAFSNKIVDGAYDTMMNKIKTGNIPNLFYLHYNHNSFAVHNLLIIPKHYFTPNIIEKRKPLAPTARRAGWVGCNINLTSIPQTGKLYIINDQKIIAKNKIIKSFNQMLFLCKHTTEIKGWLLDILKCIELLNKKTFTLTDLYFFEPILAQKHPSNNNIKAKIRQQLQILRDNHYLNFINPGTYQIIK